VIVYVRSGSKINITYYRILSGHLHEKRRHFGFPERFLSFRVRVGVRVRVMVEVKLNLNTFNIRFRLNVHSGKCPRFLLNGQSLILVRAYLKLPFFRSNFTSGWTVLSLKNVVQFQIIIKINLTQDSRIYFNKLMMVFTKSIFK